jgi:aryl carrier-like protein
MTQPLENMLVDIESRLEQICCQVLSIERIERSTNILDVGGNSLPVIALVSLIRQEMGADVSVADIFRAPTLAQLTVLVANRGVNPGSA